MDVVFTCSADVFCGYIAVLVLGFSAQDVFQVHLGCVQLGFGRGFVRSGQWGVAQCGVAQSAHCTGRAVNADRFATVLADFDGVGQFQLYAAFNGVADNVAVAFDVDRAAQRVFVAAGGTANVDAFGHFLTHFVQCVLNSMYRCTFRTVGMFDGKVGRCDRAVWIDSRIQCFGNRVQLAEVHCVGIRRTFGYVGNFVAAVVQTVFGQGYGRACRTVGNVQTVGRQYAVTCGHFRRGQSGSGQFAVANCHFVERYVVFGLNRQVFAAAFHSDVLTLFHGHGVACCDFFAVAVGFVVGFQLPTFVGCRFH